MEITLLQNWEHKYGTWNTNMEFRIHVYGTGNTSVVSLNGTLKVQSSLWLTVQCKNMGCDICFPSLRTRNAVQVIKTLMKNMFGKGRLVCTGNLK